MIVGPNCRSGDAFPFGPRPVRTAAPRQKLFLEFSARALELDGGGAQSFRHVFVAG
jgi:hypothetical protein